MMTIVDDESEDSEDEMRMNHEETKEDRLKTEDDEGR